MSFEGGAFVTRLFGTLVLVEVVRGGILNGTAIEVFRMLKTIGHNRNLL